MSERATLDEFSENTDSEQNNEWRNVRLGEISKKRSNNVDPQKVELDRHVGLEHIHPNTPYPSWESLEDLSSTKRRFEAGDVLFAKLRPNLEKSAQPDFDGVSSTDIFPIAAKEGLNSKFLLYRLSSKSAYDYARRTSAGTRMPRTSWNLFSNFEFGLPPLTEQRKIATVLYTVDQAIEKTEVVIERLEKLRDGLTQDVLTKGYYDHEEYKTVRLGPIKTSIPTSWDLKSIPDYFEIIDGDRGKNYPSGSEVREEGYCVFLSATNVTDEGLKFEETEFITEEKDSELRKGKLNRGDIVMTTRGTVGNFGLYDDTVDYDNIRINSGMVILRPKKNNSLTKYYYHLFQSQIFQKQINATSYGTAQPQTSVTDMKKMGVLEPIEDEKKQIVKLFDNINLEIQSEKDYKHQLKSMKRGLMQDLLSGTVRTTDTNITVPDEVAQHG